jgi:energy-coupling factor transport system ATP-binding protein
MIRLSLKNICYRYTGVNASDRWILDDVSLEIGANECVALVGPSGSGKTTLIQHFTGLLKPAAGEISWNGENIWASHFKQNILRQKIGIVFQFPESQLFEETVAKDVAFGPQNLGVRGEDIDRTVDEALRTVHLDPQEVSSRSPFRLSEGEKRRVAIAGVLAMDPDLVVFDEPTAGLDPGGVRLMANIVRELSARNKSVVIVTHNMDFVAEVCSRVVLLSEGSIRFDGLPGELFANRELLQQSGLDLPSLVTALQDSNLSIPEEMRNCISLQQLEEKLQQAYLS